VLIVAWFLFLFFLWLNVVDGVLTYKILRRGGGEKNPFVRWLMRLFGVVNGLVLAKGLAAVTAAAMFWVLEGAPHWLALVMGLACIIFGYVDLHNYRVWKRMQGRLAARARLLQKLNAPYE
jgi:hypothetical protein